MHLKTEGLILRQTDYRESDRLLNVLTRDHGRMTLRARGVRSRRSHLQGSCQLLCYSEFTLFEGRGGYVIDEAVPIEMFPALRKDLALVSLASYFAQIAEVVAQEDCPSPALLSLCLNAMYALNTLHKNPTLVKAAFELRCACLAGFEPMLDACPVCGSATPDRFDPAAATVICAHCLPPEAVGLPLAPGILDAMRYLVGCDTGRLFSFSLGSLDQLSRLTEQYLSEHLERRFSALDFYKSLLVE